MPGKKNCVIGIDLGGTKILTALLDQRHRILSEVKTKTRPEKGERYVLKRLQESVQAVVKDAGVSRSDVIGVGIGCPGLIDEKKGVVTTSPNMSFLKQYPLASKMARLLKLRVNVANDVKMGLYGEYRWGAARGYSHVVGLFIGTGIGGALILNRELYVGSSGAAGEVGHLMMDPQGPFCGCGRRGCLEAMAGRLAIGSEAAALAAKQKAPSLLKKVGTNVLDIKSSALAKAIKAGDRMIEQLVRSKARLVGIAMAHLVNVLNPELIVLGGGLVEALPAWMVKEAELSMRQHAMEPLAKQVRVTAAQLKDHAGAFGAAQRAWERFGTHG